VQESENLGIAGKRREKEIFWAIVKDRERIFIKFIIHGRI